MSTDRREKLKQAILQGKVKDEKSALLWVLKEKQKEQLVKEVIAEIPQAKKGDKGDKGDKGEKGEAGKNGKNGKDGKSGKDAVVDTDKIVATATKRATQAIEPLIPDIHDIEKELPQLGAEIRDGLELLQDDERLDASAIKNLPEHTEEIKKLGKRVDGLGGSQARNFYQLYDVPQSYAGQAGKAVSVKSTEDGLEFSTGGSVSDEAYGATWDGVTTIAPSKNAVYDKIETLSSYTDEQAQDAVGAMIGGSLQYVDATPLLDTIQDIQTTASPQFANLILTGGGNIYPTVDSTTAIQFVKADSTSHVATFDTTNARLKIGNDVNVLTNNYGLVVGVASGAVTKFYRGTDVVEMGGSVNWFNITGSSNGAPLTILRQNGIAPILSLQDGATVVWQVLDGGNMVMARDNTKFLMGAGSDASMYYDGTDFVINPKEVGTGYLSLLGSLTLGANEVMNLSGSGYVDSPYYKAGGTNPVADGTYNFDGSAAGTVATMTIKGGIITGITTR